MNRDRIRSNNVGLPQTGTRERTGRKKGRREGYNRKNDRQNQRKIKAMGHIEKSIVIN